MTSDNKDNGSGGKNGWRGFVSVPLSTTDTIDVIEHAVGDRTLDDTLLEIVSDGYKVSVSPLQDGSGFCVSATGKGEDNPNKGFTMTTFAGSVGRGILATWYKIYVLCEGDAWKLPERETGLEI